MVSFPDRDIFYFCLLHTGATSALVNNYQHYLDLIPETSRPKLQHEIKFDEHICRLTEKMAGWKAKFYNFELDYNPDVHDILMLYEDNLALQ